MSAPQKRAWRKFELTDDLIQRMQWFADAGKPMSAVARAFRVDPKVIRNACKAKGLGDWMAENFPTKQGTGGGPAKGGELKSKLEGETRKLSQADTLEPLKIPNSVQTKWLTKSWRKAA